MHLNSPILSSMSTPRGQVGSSDSPAPPTIPTYTVFLSEPDPAVDSVVTLSGFVDPGTDDVVLMCFLSSSGSGPWNDEYFDITITTGSVVSGGGALLFFSPDSNGDFTLEILALNGSTTPRAYVTSGGASHTSMASRELDYT